MINMYQSNERDNHIRNLGILYHVLCEQYDRKHLSGRDNYGEAMPVDARERMLMNANCLRVRQNIRRISRKYGFEDSNVSNAVRAASSVDLRYYLQDNKKAP